jgi:transcriptional regulator with PAS, ATPase and Fis domain
MRPTAVTDLIGASESIKELRSEILRVARSDAKVLITGESGVGKEIVARALNAASPRFHAAFVPVNCAGIPETLLESELFGHVKGSFTGAFRDRPGKLEMASNGTIFLDEIGEMTLRMQGLLLRFLETGEIQKVGAERVGTAPNVRVIAATNRDLRELVAGGQFRDDLFYRLNVIHLIVPPLRERREDIPALVEHFMKNFTTGQGNNHGNDTVARAIAPETVAVLSQYSWPGNVRQLENVIERLVVSGRREVITVDDLPLEIRSPLTGGRPRRERRRTIAEELFKRLTDEQESFWTVVYPLYMNREITRGNVRDLVHRGLEEARGNYKIVLRLFNMESRDYKRFLNFLRKHDCQLPFKEYRQ